MLLLDNDPVICATNTPVSLYEYIINSLKSAFKEANDSASIKQKSIAEPTDLKELFLNDIGYSKRNRDWLVDYYNTLSMNSNKTFGTKYSAIKCFYTPRNNTGIYYSNKFQLHKPIYDNKYTQLFLDNSDIYRGITDDIELSRLMLMNMEPTADEFPFGEPGWLHTVEYRDFVAFDPIQKLYIKIVRVPDGYRYFTSYISNNWKEVYNVPPEIDKIIDCILVNKV